MESSSSLDVAASRVPLSATVSSMASLRPGDQLVHYRVEELVARSGMASIYRATDMRNGRPVPTQALIQLTFRLL